MPVEEAVQNLSPELNLEKTMEKEQPKSYVAINATGFWKNISMLKQVIFKHLENDQEMGKNYHECNGNKAYEVNLIFFHGRVNKRKAGGNKSFDFYKPWYSLTV